MSELLWYGFLFSGRSEKEVSLFEPVPEGETLYLTKKPPDTSRIRRVFLADEQLFVICMLRDPRSVASSRHKKYPDVYFSDFRRWLEYEAEIRQLAQHPRFLLVRYEELLTDPDAIQQEILSRFPSLELQRRFSEYPADADPGERAHIAMHSVRAVDPGRIEGWREHLPRVKDQLVRYPQILEPLVRYGYEPDDNWLNCLDAVEPAGITHKPKPHIFRSTESNLRFWWKTRRYLKQLH
jgi:hypothetical protein